MNIIKTTVFIFLIFFCLVSSASATHQLCEDGVMHFSGVQDIPTLYSEINNESQLSYSDGIYIMKIPFFKDADGSTFLFNETVRLLTNNTDSSRAYFEADNVSFNGANVIGWSGILDTACPVYPTYTYRPYIFINSTTCPSGQNITNSTFKNLGDESKGVSSFGVSIHGINNKTISNCIFDNGRTGLYLTAAMGDNIPFTDQFTFPTNDTYIINCTFSNNSKHGLYFHEYNWRNHIYNSTAVNCAAGGFELYQSSDCEFINNTAVNCTYGFEQYDQCINNSFINSNLVSSIFSVFGSNYTTALNTTITNQKIYIGNYANNNVFINTTITDTNPGAAYGIHLVSGANNNTFQNIITEKVQMNYLNGCGGSNKLLNVSILNSTGRGIFLYSGANNTIIDNATILNSGDHGIRIHSSANCTINNIYINNTLAGKYDYSIEDTAINTTISNILNGANTLQLIGAANVFVQNDNGRYLSCSGNTATVSSAGIYSLPILNIPSIYQIQTYNLYLIPSSGILTSNVSVWNTTGDYKKTWDESTDTHETITSHIIGDMPSDTIINIKRNDTSYVDVGTNSSGYLLWTYSGGYSDHEFTAEPSDGFYATTISGSVPLHVGFNNLYIGDENWVYSWDFENDGVIDSIEQNPTYIYGRPENYTINLTVQNEYGNFSTMKTDYITVEPANITNVSLEVNDLTHDDYATTTDSIRFKKSNLWSNFTIQPDNQINVTIDRWDVTGDYIKIWNESSSIANTATVHQITGFPVNTFIDIYRDGIIYDSIKSDSLGTVNWVYNGGYSEHTFEAIPHATAGVRDSFVDSWENTVSMVGAIIILSLAGSIIMMIRGKKDMSSVMTDMQGILIVVVLVVIGAIIFGQF